MKLPRRKAQVVSNTRSHLGICSNPCTPTRDALV
ncbi:hypothetical protein SEA_ZEPP_7 [Microbacterium phage Zepp]|nr:hypothetical protein SEA_ZEPP_7 [Microbacterium phage Zepp]